GPERTDAPRPDARGEGDPVLQRLDGGYRPAVAPETYRVRPTVHAGETTQPVVPGQHGGGSWVAQRGGPGGVTDVGECSKRKVETVGRQTSPTMRPRKWGALGSGEGILPPKS